MRALLDSCSVINVVHAEALGLICSLPEIDWWLPPMVVNECGTGCAGPILEAHQNGQLHFCNDDQVDSEQYVDLLLAHSLGEGETECIAIARSADFAICCDDRRARRVAAALIGDDRVFGTIRVLRWCVEAQLIACGEAKALLTQMRARGGYLPDMAQEFFCSGND